MEEDVIHTWVYLWVRRKVIHTWVYLWVRAEMIHTWVYLWVREEDDTHLGIPLGEKQYEKGMETRYREEVYTRR